MFTLNIKSSKNKRDQYNLKTKNFLKVSQLTKKIEIRERERRKKNKKTHIYKSCHILKAIKK